MKSKIPTDVQDLCAAADWDLNVIKVSTSGLREGRLSEAEARKGIIEGSLSAEAALKDLRRLARKLKRQ